MIVCLINKNIGDDEYNYGKRSCIYFKECLLHNCKDNQNNKLLFEYANHLVDKLLIKQKKFIGDNIENEKKNNKMVNNGTNYAIFYYFLYKSNCTRQFGQDRIDNSIKCLL